MSPTSHRPTSAVDDVAAAFVAALGPMTAMKLEKLVYYAQATHLKDFDTALFDDDIEAWTEGPVVRSLFTSHSGCREVRDWPRGNPDHLSGDAMASVRSVVERYGDFSGEELSDIAHREAPWRVTRGDLPATATSRRVIDKDLIRDFYQAQSAVTTTAIASVIGSAALEGADFSDAQVEMLEDLAQGKITVDSVLATVRKAR